MRIKFLFGQVPLSSVKVIRAAIGIVILLSVLNDLPFLTQYYSNEGLVQGERDLFREHYRFSLLDYFSEPWHVIGLSILLCISLVFLIISRYPRVAAGLSFILLSSFHEANILVLNSGDTLMRILLFLLIFVGYQSTSGKKSCDVWPIRLIQFQLCVVYLFAFLTKTGNTYKDGTALYYFLSNEYFARIAFSQLEMVMPLLIAGTYAMLLIEAVFPFLVWVSQTRPYVNGAAMLLQLGILVSVNITFFSLIMLAAHLTFFDPKTLDSLYKKWAKGMNTFKKRL